MTCSNAVCFAAPQDHHASPSCSLGPQSPSSWANRPGASLFGKVWGQRPCAAPTGRKSPALCNPKDRDPLGMMGGVVQPKPLSTFTSSSPQTVAAAAKCCIGRHCRMALPPSPPVQLHQQKNGKTQNDPQTQWRGSLPEGLLHMLRSTAETSHPTRAAQVLPWTPVGGKNRFPPPDGPSISGSFSLFRWDGRKRDTALLPHLLKYS